LLASLTGRIVTAASSAVGIGEREQLARSRRRPAIRTTVIRFKRRDCRRVVKSCARMTRPYRLLLAADVGGEGMRHIGDEAMLEANLDAFRRFLPQATYTLAASGQSIQGADAVVISGGGNLSSSWPHLLHERVALLQLARRFGLPAVVVGQTIGPNLRDEERSLLSDSLSYARFVGVRELPSAALALGLGIPPARIWYQCDDAMFLDSGTPQSAEPRIAVTIDPQVRAAGGEVYGALIRQLRELSRATGAPLVLIPHAFGDESPGTPSDLTEARLLAEAVALPGTVIAAGLSAREAKRLTGESSLVISTRYHPLVFGLAAGVPSLGIYADEYTRVKLQGALMHAGRERWTLSYPDVARGELLPKAVALWEARSELREELTALLPAWAEEHDARWSAILRALDPAAALPANAPGTIFGRPAAEVAPSLAAALDARREAMEGERARFAEPQREHSHLGKRLRRYASLLLRRRW
jgi:polysaccharide pyruvyl transferase WcaK-like protein